MTDDELSGLRDGTVVFDPERNEYGRVVFDECNSDAITVEWFSGVTRTLPFCWCRNIQHAFGDVHLVVELHEDQEEEE